MHVLLHCGLNSSDRTSSTQPATSVSALRSTYSLMVVLIVGKGLTFISDWGIIGDMPNQATQNTMEATPEQTPEKTEGRSRSMMDKLSLAVPPRELLIPLSVLFATLLVIADPVTAAPVSGGVTGNNASGLKNTLQDIGNFVSLIVIGIAVPNGAYGFLQYMTAGSNVEQDEKGRERIRNTFIGLAGVAIIQGAVAIFNNTIGISVSTGST